MPEANVLKPDLEFIRQVLNTGGENLKKCYQCATCSVVCNLSSQDTPFPRRQLFMAQWGQKDSLLSDPSIWLCHQCNDCSNYCPRAARPGDILASLRAYAFRHFAFPAFMGKALANPGALPYLFMLPVLIMLIILFSSSAGDFSYLLQLSGQVDYARAFPHISLDVVFVSGNILVFAFAAVGLARFWKKLKGGTAQENGAGFLSALIATFKEILFHQKFSKCDTDRFRSSAHLLIFFGFAGALLATALNFFTTVILKFLGSSWFLQSPIDFPNPIKILGIISGIAILTGGWILIKRRKSSDERIGISQYNDWLFLTVITLVALTGILAWILRLLSVPLIAYSDYFLHLVLVFFLLWYAPYSKFAHMFYRTLAIAYAKSVGRDQPRDGGSIQASSR